MPHVRFLFDEHVSRRAQGQLRKEGVDVSHVAELGLGGADDADVLARAVEEERIVVTRNYRDFAPLVEAYVRKGLEFPGVLFLPASLRQNDVGGHVRQLLAWIERVETSGSNPIRNGLGWL